MASMLDSVDDNPAGAFGLRPLQLGSLRRLGDAWAPTKRSCVVRVGSPPSKRTEKAMPFA